MSSYLLFEFLCATVLHFMKEIFCLRVHVNCIRMHLKGGDPVSLNINMQILQTAPHTFS